MTENIDSSILLGFVDEARSYLPTIRQGIARYQADENCFAEIELAHRQIHTIRGAAMMVGLEELSRFAGAVEDCLEVFTTERGKLSAETAASLLTNLDRVEISLETSATAFSSGSFSGDEFGASFADSAEFAEMMAGDNADFSITTAEMDESAEIDPELLEVFALEADDHLQNISLNLAILEHSPQNKPALSEIRRSSHTLKGAAGVVGFKTITKLAHRMEDLLDYLAENPEASNNETTVLLISATDVLEALSRGQSELTLKTELETAYTRFEKLFATIHTASGQTAQLPVSDEENTSGANENQSHANENHSHNLVVAPRPTVRVSVENLDILVNLISELIINRTMMEQKINFLEKQVSELNLSTKRLRRLANKLDADYEAGTLGITQPFAFSQAAQISPAFGGLPLAAGNIGDAGKKYGFDDLEFDRYNEFHQVTRELLETSSDSAAVSGDLEELLGDLDTVLTRQRRLTDEMQEKLMRVRMVPFGSILSRLQRTVRVVAEQENKLADFSLEGETIELDTQVLDAIAEPLLHLLRNAVGHGIESPEERFSDGKSSRGTIRMKIFHEATFIVITIADDGRGIDPHRLRERAVKNGFISMQEAAAMSDEETFSLIFLPGLSTARELTNISGRGVGMDIVREVISRQQGTITLKSVPNKGTTFTIRLPVTMAVTRSLIVRVGGQSFALPLAVVSRVINATSDDFDLMSTEKVMWVGGKFYPVFILNELLHSAAVTDFESSRISALILNIGDVPTALVVDQIIEATEIVLKPFNNLLRNLRGYLGATILGNGEVVPILDIVSLLSRQPAKTSTSEPQNVMPVVTATQAVHFTEQLTVMIVDDSPSVRRVMTNLVTNAGWKVLAAKDGLEALESLQSAKQLPHIILSDVEMPRMDGYELLSSLKRQEAFAHIPVVMITSRAAEKHRRKALDLGASDYVTKPYQDSFLTGIIRDLTEKLEVSK